MHSKISTVPNVSTIAATIGFVKHLIAIRGLVALRMTLNVQHQNILAQKVAETNWDQYGTHFAHNP